jgi:serine/threonine-protein kinase HipA
VRSLPRTDPAYLAVSTPQGASGGLQHEGDAFLFTCVPDSPREAEVSLTMPRRAAPYVGTSLLPVFQMNLPEGYVLEQLRQRFAKASRLSPMLLLALTGQDAAIGRVQLTSSALASPGENRGERLAEILAWDGTEDLFAALADRYLLRTGASGVQPKLLVPEDTAGTSGKALVATSELIVKSAGTEYPGLAINEYVCMSIAREAGLPVPEFWLSANAQLFVMRRFDRAPSADALGFEDMAVLMGLGADQKYTSSYERIARAIDVFCSPAHQAAGLAQLFDQVALTCLVGNGDAHLKNFGVLYGQPHDADVRLAPVYDIVNTTAYLPSDELALSLGGSKGFFPARVALHDFARRCGISDAADRLNVLIQAAHGVLAREEALLRSVPQVAAAIRASIAPYELERRNKSR